MSEFKNPTPEEEVVETQTKEVSQPIENQPSSVSQEVEPIVEETVEQKTEEPQEQQPTTQEPQEDVNQQYTDNNVFEEPKNYYQQKHYIPTGFGGTPQQEPITPPQNNNGKKGFKVFIAILLAVVIFVVGAGVGKLSGGIDLNDVISIGDKEDSLKYSGEDIEVDSGNTVQRDDIKPDENGRYTADQVADLVDDSVVNIQVYSKTDETVGATASGVILNKDGYIITNDHIYSEVKNAKFIVTLNDNKSYKASYVAGDKRSDIAVLKFDEKVDGIIPATFADSSQVASGDDVIAIGSPYGLSGTVTKGIVSYPSRRITTSTTDASGQATASYSMRVIQTDVALNSGNSGGALVNMYGQVIGINSSKIAISGYEGLCFAIPANDVIKYAKSLVKNGVVANRARLGITYTAITSATALVNDLPAGLLVQEIDPESELSKKDITVGENGDIITKMNGKEITSSDIALDIIDDSEAGDKITVTVYSRKTKREKTFTIHLLEDKSNTSYVNEIPKPTTTQSQEDAFGYGEQNQDDFYGYEEFFESPFDFGR